jgi:STE24 endopeptidase
MNSLALLIVLSLFLLWNLEFIATLLNLKTFPATPPPELAGLMDQEKLDKARDYLSVNSRFDIVRASVSLAILLAFWWLGGFLFLDSLARSLCENLILAGLIFLSALFVAQNLISLPFDWYETFVIEEKFGFNKSTTDL